MIILLQGNNKRGLGRVLHENPLNLALYCDSKLKVAGTRD